jgi:hypothetical protein
MAEERKEGEIDDMPGRRVFGLVARGYPQDFQAWLDSAKTYGIYVIFSKSSRTGKLIVKEETW